MTEWVLVGCVKGKRDHPTEAKSLYKSPLYLKRRRFAEHRGDGWGILSAKHGYLSPETRTEPYDLHRRDVDDEEWANAVLDDLLPVLEENDVTTVTILAGKKYVEPIEPTLEQHGYDVIDFNRGLRPGERMSRLNAQFQTTLP